MALYVRKLDVNDGEDVYRLLQSLPAEENGFVNSVFGKSYEEYRLWLKGAAANAAQQGIVDGWKVPQSTFWFYLDQQPIGYGKIRHCLTEQLKKSGGHIGLSIHPGYRGMGYGTYFMGKLVEESRELGIETLLFTIKNANVASIKAALANGGVIERISDERHYITLKSSV